MSVKQTIEKDWTKLEGFVRTMELKLFGGKLAQKATHPMTGETKWVEVEDGDAPAKTIAEIKPGTTQVDSSGTNATGTSETTLGSGQTILGTATNQAPPPGGLHPPTDAHYPASVSGAPAPLPGGVVQPGQEQGSPTGTPLPAGVTLGTGTST